VTNIYNHTTIINNYVVNNTTIINEGVGRDRVARITHHDVDRVVLHEVNHPNAALHESGPKNANTLTVFRPTPAVMAKAVAEHPHHTPVSVNELQRHADPRPIPGHTPPSQHIPAGGHQPTGISQPVNPINPGNPIGQPTHFPQPEMKNLGGQPQLHSPVSPVAGPIHNTPDAGTPHQPGHNHSVVDPVSKVTSPQANPFATPTGRLPAQTTPQVAPTHTPGVQANRDNWQELVSKNPSADHPHNVPAAPPMISPHQADHSYTPPVSVPHESAHHVTAPVAPQTHYQTPPANYNIPQGNFNPKANGQNGKDKNGNQ